MKIHRTAIALIAAAALSCGGASHAQTVTQGWTPLKDLGTVAIHMELLPNGQLYMFDYFQNFRLMDVATEKITATKPPFHVPFCGSNSLLADGRLFLSGGGGGEPKSAISTAGIYDPWLQTWTYLPAMNAKRWYNTSLTLATGNVLEAGGAGLVVPMQEYLVDANAWRTLPGLMGPDYFYPRLFVAPNGLVFDAGISDETGYIDISDAGSFTFVSNINFGYRNKGSVVMYDTGKLLVVGGAPAGASAATNTAEIIDLTQPNPAWQYTGSMHYARKDLTTVIEPNGKVLAIGGVAGPDVKNTIYSTEEWDPATGLWTVLPSIDIHRGYHSTALLLPDGRIVSAGSVKPNYQIYTPDYLTHGPRPTISDAPDVVTIGTNFDVSTPDAADIQNVNILRLGTTTHAVNYDQRICKLGFTRDDGVLHVTAPTSPNVAVPGYYMLFILNSAGTPSVAKIFRVTQPDVAPPADVTARALSARKVKLNWTDMSAKEDSYGIDRQEIANPGDPPVLTHITLPKNTLGYVDTDVDANRQYIYVVKAIAADLTEYAADPVTVLTPSLKRPGQPTNPRAVAGATDGTIIFTWRDADDLESSLIVERSVDRNNWSIAATMPENSTSYYDHDLTGGTRYYYRVSASNSAGPSAPSSMVNAVAPGTGGAPLVSGLTLNPPSLRGGSSSTATVFLDKPAVTGGSVVTLSSDHSEAPVPATITVPAGAKSVPFTVSTSAVPSQVVATISATLGVTKTATLTIGSPAITGVSLQPTVVAGGNSAIGTVTLEGPAPTGGMQVALNSSKPDATVPASVTVAEGQSSATFTVNTTIVSANVKASITATAGGVSKDTGLKITPIRISSLTLTPSKLTGGLSSVGQVTLNAAAGPGGVVITLTDGCPSSSIPATVTVPAGQTTVTFPIDTSVVTVKVFGLIQAAIGGTGLSAKLTVFP